MEAVKRIKEELLKVEPPFTCDSMFDRIATCLDWQELKMEDLEDITDTDLYGDLSTFKEAYNIFVKKKMKSVLLGVTMLGSSLMIWLCFSVFIHPPYYFVWVTIMFVLAVFGVKNGLNLIVAKRELEQNLHLSLDALITNLSAREELNK